MADFTVVPFGFEETTVSFMANNAEAKNRIYGGVLVSVLKSEAQRFFDDLIKDGFTIATE